MKGIWIVDAWWCGSQHQSSSSHLVQCHRLPSEGGHVAYRLASHSSFQPVPVSSQPLHNLPSTRKLGCNQRLRVPVLELALALAAPAADLVLRVLASFVAGAWGRSSGSRCCGCFPLVFDGKTGSFRGFSIPIPFSLSFSLPLSSLSSFSGSWGFQSRNFLREALLPLSAYSALVTARRAKSPSLANACADVYASVMGLGSWEGIS